MNEFMTNTLEVCGAVIGGLTLASVALSYFSTATVSDNTLNRPITDEEAAMGYDDFKVIEPSRGSKLLKKLGL